MMKHIKTIYLIITCMLFLCGCSKSQNESSLNEVTLTEQIASSSQSGINVQRVCLSAEGYMLDFRYQVVDPSLAVKLMERDAEYYVIDQKSGSKMIVPAPPKVGSLRQKTPNPVEGKVYYVMFANPGRMVKRNDKVTVVIDELYAFYKFLARIK